MANERQSVNVQAGMGWIGWFFLLFWNFGDNTMDLYDALYAYLATSAGGAM